MRQMLVPMIAAMLAAISVAATAHDYTIGELTIGHPHARATPPAAQTGAGYLTITNNGAEADRLVAIVAGFAASAAIHLTTMDENVMRMRQVEGGIEIPAGATVALEPGGAHVMFIGLEAPLAEGETRAVTLIFERAGTVEVELDVESMGGGADHGSKGDRSPGHGN